MLRHFLLALAALALFIRWSKTPAQRVFDDAPGCHELQQVVGPAAFGTDAGHLEPTERMAFNQRPRAATVDVEVADAEFPSSFGDIFRASRKYRTRQGILRAVCHLQGFLEVSCLHDSEYGPENLFLCQAVFRTDIGKNGERNKEGVKSEE